MPTQAVAHCRYPPGRTGPVRRGPALVFRSNKLRYDREEKGCTKKDESVSGSHRLFWSGAVSSIWWVREVSPIVDSRVPVFVHSIAQRYNALLPSVPQPASPPVKVVAALLLAGAAGFVDAFGFLFLVRLFTSHMTGNLSGMGLYAALHDLHAALARAWPVASFLAGLFAGAALTEWGRRRAWQSRLSLVLAVEIVLLLALWALAPAQGSDVGRFGLVALPALAMGMQTVTVTRARKLRFYTTYMTGNLAKFAEAVVQYAFGIGDRVRARRRGDGPPAGESQQDALHHLLLTLGLWLAFLAGAYLGAAGFLVAHVRALTVPLAALSIVLLVDLLRPLAPVAAGESPGLHL